MKWQLSDLNREAISTLNATSCYTDNHFFNKIQHLATK